MQVSKQELKDIWHTIISRKFTTGAFIINIVCILLMPFTNIKIFPLMVYLSYGASAVVIAIYIGYDNGVQEKVM
jgi:hypothetical protein